MFAGIRASLKSAAQRSIDEPPRDAVPVDTTDLALEAVIDQIITLAVEAREVGA